MPVYIFECPDCGFSKKHFLRSSSDEKTCPECGSEDYSRKVSMPKTKINYRDPKEMLEKVIEPSINETYEQIGKELINQDTETLENIFGEDTVSDTFHKTDD